MKGGPGGGTWWRRRGAGAQWPAGTKLSQAAVPRGSEDSLLQGDSGGEQEGLRRELAEARGGAHGGAAALARVREGGRRRAGEEERRGMKKNGKIGYVPSKEFNFRDTPAKELIFSI